MCLEKNVCQTLISNGLKNTTHKGTTVSNFLSLIVNSLHASNDDCV